MPWLLYCTRFSSYIGGLPIHQESFIWSLSSPMFMSSTFPRVEFFFLAEYAMSSSHAELEHGLDTDSSDPLLTSALFSPHQWRQDPPYREQCYKEV